MTMRKVLKQSLCLYVFSFLFVLIGFLSPANAENIYVYPPSQAQQLSDNESEINTLGVTVMYPNIQAAINAAADGDVIYLGKGTYTGDGNRDLDFGGKAITLSGLDPNDANVVAATIIDCNGTSTEYHRGFYFHSGEDNNSVVCGITITNAYYKYYGSAIYCTASSPIIHHCNIVANYGVSGNAIYLSGGHSILADCTIADNNTPNAIFAYGTSSKYIQIKNCTIKNNTCYGIYGGEYIEILNCSIEYNKSQGIYLRGSTSVNISGCLIRGNGTNKSDTGGIYGRCYIENSTIIDNNGTGITYCTEVNNCFVAYNSGNGLSSCTTVINSKIIGNGKIGLQYPTSIQNCVIAKNKKQGVYYPYKKLTNCTIIDNGGAGVQIVSSAVTIKNCIVRDNYLEQIKGVLSTTKITYTNSYDIDEYNYDWKILYDGTGNIDADPCFVSESDWHILPGSPCVDAGTNDANYVTEANDIEGSGRIIDGDVNGIATADIGAYEYNTNGPVIAVWADRLVCLTNAGNEVKGKIYIKNAGAGTLNYEFTSDENWLAIDNPIGTSTDEIQEVNVSIDANSLDIGDYHCRIKVYSDNAAGSPVEYWLNVHIGSLWTVPVDVNTIQAAIDAASDYDYICVLDGNYMGTGNRNINFSDKNIVLYSENGAENCIINCQGYNVFRVISGETEAIIDGFSVFRGGAVVTCDACSSPVVTNCIFTNCSCGIYLQNYSNVKMIDCAFKGYITYGVYGYYKGCNKVEIRNCEFPNKIYNYGIYVDCLDKLILRDCNMTGASNNAIYCYRAKEVIIENCSLQNSSGDGISLYEIGKFVIRNTDVSENKGNGIHSTESGKGEISDCTIVNNGFSSKYSYYGIYAYLYNYSDVLIKNCLIAGNSYGCYVYGSSRDQISFENCTFDGNRNYLLYRRYNSPTIFKNCIMWDPNLIYQSGTSSTSVDISYCNVRGGWDGVGNISTDPCFVSDGYWDANGTSRITRDDFWVEGDYHLKSFGWRWDSSEREWVFDRVTSRCIDAGSPGYPLGNEPLSVSEDSDNEWGENLRIDMGYYGGTAEASMPPYDWALLSDMDNSGGVDFSDYSYLSDFYGLQDENLDGDLNRDGSADWNDIALFADDWLGYTDWASR